MSALGTAFLGDLANLRTELGVDQTNINITGGQINGTTVGLTTAAAGSFTTVVASGAVNLNSTLNVLGAWTHTGSVSTAGSLITTSSLALQLGPNAAIRDYTNGASTIYFDASAGGTTHGSFV